MFGMTATQSSLLKSKTYSIVFAEMAAKLSLSKGQKEQGKTYYQRTRLYEIHAPVGQGAQRGAEPPNCV